MNLWDQRYNSSGFLYGKEPNLFFAEFLLSQKTAGKILLPAEGEGRNAVFAAESGWEVVAFDSSTVAREKALKYADESGVKIKYELSDLKDFQPQPDEYDVIASVFAHVAPDMREQFHRKLVLSLKPGGYICVVAFAKEQLLNDSGGPKEENMLYSTEILKSDFQGLTIFKLCHEKVYLDEGRHSGLADIVGLIGKKEPAIIR